MNPDMRDLDQCLVPDAPEGPRLCPRGHRLIGAPSVRTAGVLEPAVPLGRLGFAVVAASPGLLVLIGEVALGLQVVVFESFWCSFVGHRRHSCLFGIWFTRARTVQTARSAVFGLCTLGACLHGKVRVAAAGDHSARTSVVSSVRAASL